MSLTNGFLGRDKHLLLLPNPFIILSIHVLSEDIYHDFLPSLATPFPIHTFDNVHTSTLAITTCPIPFPLPIDLDLLNCAYIIERPHPLLGPAKHSPTLHPHRHPLKRRRVHFDPFASADELLLVPKIEPSARGHIHSLHACIFARLQDGRDQEVGAEMILDLNVPDVAIVWVFEDESADEWKAQFCTDGGLLDGVWEQAVSISFI